eukprot:NODE_201_length_15044_cov_0.334560.p12 type:complete len:101 gc:universal NODE_201_length_15044_cov_0.334560:5244-4942(-)
MARNKFLFSSMLLIKLTVIINIFTFRSISFLSLLSYHPQPTRIPILQLLPVRLVAVPKPIVGLISTMFSTQLAYPVLQTDAVLYRTLLATSYQQKIQYLL